MIKLKDILIEANIIKKEDIAGGRMNGDDYGTDVFICKSCNWITSFQWDLGIEPPCYYEITSFPYYKKEREEIERQKHEIEKTIRKNRRSALFLTNRHPHRW
jgi:hypothetical protein